MKTSHALKSRTTPRVLTSFSTIAVDAIDRSTVRWHKELVSDMLRAVWHAKGALRMPYTVYTHRMLLKLRASFDREGYRLRAQTELARGTVTLRILQKQRGNRPSRVHR